MATIPLAQRIRYRFDNTMARGPIALIGWLLLLSIIFLVLVTLIVMLFGLDPDRRGFGDLAWAGLMRTLDAGTMGGDTGGWPFLLAMLVTTMGGIFLVSTLIGVLTTGIEGQIERLRKGRSFVAESGHTVILGWSPQIFTLVSELITANASLSRACIAILADKDAAEMQDELQSKIGNTKHTRIVCRTGVAMDIDDLRIVNPDEARAIIILPPEDDNPDAYVIKTMLALTGRPQRPAKPYHIVTYIRDAKNLEVAQMVGRDEAEVIAADDLIARVTAQTCRQSGLSVAYTELLDYDGDEIYFKAEPTLVGKTFADTLMAYEDSTVIGLRSAAGNIRLNPPMETRLESDDRLIFIAADDNAIQLAQSGPGLVDSAALRNATPRPPAPERTLILGWNERAPAIIAELDHYVGPGSEVHLVAETNPAIREFLPSPQEQNYHNLSVSVQPGDVTERRTLEALAIASFQHVIVLSEWTAGLDNLQQVDARTLITLLHLRNIAEEHGHPFSIVSEMLDVRNRELAQVTRADDFVVSDSLISLIMAQIAENKELALVFQDLFDPEGSELYFKPASDYVALSKAVNFYTVVEAAKQRGEIAIGYRRAAEAYNAAQSFGVKLNPRKLQTVSFAKEDRLIVLAEN